MGKKTSSDSLFLASVKQGIWILCIPAWLFGVVDRIATAIGDHDLSVAEAMQILTATFFLVGWLLLKPNLRRAATGPSVTKPSVTPQRVTEP